MNTTRLTIEALGNLIQYYDSDLKYITKFQEYKNNIISDEEYLNDRYGFQKFVKEYRLSRNIQKGKVENSMKLAKFFVLEQYPYPYKDLDVKGLADGLRNANITQKNKTMISLASKILFLNNPLNNIPIDTLNRKAVNLNENDYKKFKEKADKFKKENIELINDCLENVCELLNVVEEDNMALKKYLDIDFNDYRVIRYTDKLLWTFGKNHSKGDSNSTQPFVIPA